MNKTIQELLIELEQIFYLLDDNLLDELDLYQLGARDILAYLFDNSRCDIDLLEHFKNYKQS